MAIQWESYIECLGQHLIFAADTGGVSAVAIGVEHFAEVLNLLPDVIGEDSPGSDFQDRSSADENANCFIFEEDTISLSYFMPASSSCKASFGFNDMNPPCVCTDGH